MWHNRSVSVVFPVYNEEQGIVKAINDFFATGVVDEVIAVDNNSKDRSAELIRSTRATLVTETRQGYGFALRRGLAEAKSDLVILAEPDGTFLGKDVLKLLVYSDDFDIVLGTRTTPQLVWKGANMGFAMRTGNWIVAKMIEFLFNTASLSDCGCTLRLLSRDAAQRIGPLLTVGKSHLLPEIVVLGSLHRYKMIEIPVNYCVRLGESKITGDFKKTVKVALNMITLVLRYRISSWFQPRPAADPQPTPEQFSRRESR